jgi:hypothetical protein
MALEDGSEIAVSGLEGLLEEGLGRRLILNVAAAVAIRLKA